MKNVPLFVILVAACATTPEDATVQDDVPAAPDPVIQPDVCNANMQDHLTSQPWIAGSKIGAVWPGGCGIAHTQVLIRRGPNLNKQKTYFAFVVWNDTIVGHIYTVTGDVDADFHAVLDNAIATRTGSAPSHTGGQGGGTDGGTPPVPHPHVDGLNVQVTQNYLDNVIKPASVAISNAEQDIIETPVPSVK